MPDTFSNGLTPAQVERLSLLAEECVEVVQAVTKILRHGYASRHPDDPLGNNRIYLETELGDLRHAMKIVTFLDLNSSNVVNAEDAKRMAVRPYLHFEENKI